MDGLLRSSLRGLLQQKLAPAGEMIIQQGDAPSGLYFIDFGKVTVYLEMPGGEKRRLRSMGPGNIVGEMSIYLNQPASATVAAEEASLLWFLSGDQLRQLEEDDPRAAAELHRFMVRLVSERLLNANVTLRALSA